MAVKYYDWTAHQANIRPNSTALVDLDTGKNLTYKELEERANRLASWFTKNGIERGDRIALLTRNNTEFFEVQFACWKTGAICLPLNWRLTEKELTYILNDSTPSILVYESFFNDLATACINNCKINSSLKIQDGDKSSSYERAIKSQKGNFISVEATHEDISMIMYTSGTTGHPKGAMITHGMTFYNIVNLGIPGMVNDQSVQLIVLPLFHTAGLNCNANPILHAGGKVLLCREFDPGRSLAIIGDPKYSVTHLMAVPAAFQFMTQHPNFEKTDLSNLQRVGVGAAPCPEVILRTWLNRGAPMIQGWGMTETSPGATGLPLEYALEKIGSAGKALLHTEIKIVDKKGCTVKRGETGELMIRGPNVTPGYWNNEEATKKAFSEGWLKTGDAAREDDDGFLYIVDRWKDMYISGGENVYPAEVENVIYELPDIVEAAVIGVPDKKWGETGKAIIVFKNGVNLDPKIIIEHCAKNLATFKVPKTVETIEKLPRNATGKVLKRVLRRQYVENDTPAIT